MARTIGKFRKATEKEKQAWEDEKPNLCPLRGFITYNNLELAVSKASGGFLKVHAPDGQHFSPDLLHTMLCDDMDDLRDRLRASDLEACSASDATSISGPTIHCRICGTRVCCYEDEKE